MSDTTRRAVLAGAAGLTATAVLAACGDSSTSASSGDPTTAAADPTGAQAGTTASAGAPTSGAASTGLAKTADIPAGGGKIFAAKDTVITQPTAGTFKAFTATCTHQQCPVSNVSGGTINCTCHGSKYKITDGSVANGPATTGLTPKTVTVTGDDIVVS